MDGIPRQHDDPQIDRVFELGVREDLDGIESLSDSDEENRREADEGFPDDHSSSGNLALEVRNTLTANFTVIRYIDGVGGVGIS